MKRTNGILNSIKFIVILKIIVFFLGACNYNKYYKYSLESLKYYNDLSNFKRLQKLGNLDIKNRDTLINIKLGKRTLAFQDLKDKKYYIFIYHTKELTYEKYICDSNKIILDHIFHGVVY